jgi:hypothetical protein
MYNCSGGEATIVEYLIEAVEDDTLTVKVTGDGKNFGIYHHNNWQMVGTTLYLELNFKGKTFDGSMTEGSLSNIGSLAPPMRIEGTFGRQNTHHGYFRERYSTWHSTHKSHFAPALGVSLRHNYEHENRVRVACELTSIIGR